MRGDKLFKGLEKQVFSARSRESEAAARGTAAARIFCRRHLTPITGSHTVRAMKTLSHTNQMGYRPAVAAVAGAFLQ